MKHLLNDLSEQEKNSIREQHTGGMKVMTKNFSRLLKSKSGDVKTLVKEQDLNRLAKKIVKESHDMRIENVEELPVKRFRVSMSDGHIYDVFIADLDDASSILDITDEQGDMVPYELWDIIGNELLDNLFM